MLIKEKIKPHANLLFDVGQERILSARGVNI